MKVAIMMRAMDQESGFRANVETLVENMVTLGSKHNFLLLYRTQKNLGKFTLYPNVKEFLIKTSNKFIWDQFSVLYVSLKERADIIFNPKFSVPLLSPIPVTMGLQEHGFLTHPEFYEKWDVRYQRAMMPRYIHKCAHLFPMSKFALEENRRVLNLPLSNATVIYAGSSKEFRPIQKCEIISSFINKYKLPEKFILSVTRVDHTGLEGSTSFYGGKMPEITFRAFNKIKSKIPHTLVFAGKRIKEYLLYTEGKNIDLERVEFTEFVPYDEMPLLYNAADIFINSAPNEGFGMVNVQAMACGKAAVLANSGGSAEVGKDAALFAEPGNVNELSEKMLALLTDNKLKSKVENLCLIKSKDFSYENSAKICLDTLENLVSKKHRNN
jgi:glycosyltransferase involved in cell wall biosynthesis